MKRFLVALSLVLVAISQPAFAVVVDTFDFSYVSTSNVTVTGTFTGVEGSGTVSVIDVNSLTIGGTSLSTPIVDYSFGGTADAALASYSLSGNSFLFLSGANYFQIGTGTYGNFYVNAYLGANPFPIAESNTFGNWTLTKQAGNGVPDSGNMALLLSGGLMGLIAFRRARIVV